MIRFSVTRSILGVILLDAICMYALHASLDPPVGRRPRLLFIGSGTDEYWQRTVEGAQDAAHELGIELEVQLPTRYDLIDQQNSIVQSIDAAGYDGVAFSPVDPESQIELINNLAERTKLVTVDRDDCKSQRLCHIGFGQWSAGALAARLVRDQLSRPGKIALLTTTISDAPRESNVSERLAGFKETWGPFGHDPSKPCPILEVAKDTDFSAALADPELALIVAFDSKSAESALKALNGPPNRRRVPIIAFDPSETIFDAIVDGRVCSAIFHDPYHSGFEAIQRLSAYRSRDKESLPVPGHGSFLLASEVVQKENLADIRRRLDGHHGDANVSASRSGPHQLPQASCSAPTNADRGASS